MIVFRQRLCLIAMVCLLPIVATAVERFPKPDFESGYTQRTATHPSSRPDALQVVDVTILLAALAAATWLALKNRSRRGLFLLTLFSLLYFGFWRKGCVCPVGSIQNMALAFSTAKYAVPVAVIVFFAAPLLVALFAGRTFCASVCPLGAVQELVVLKPVKTPGWLDPLLRLLPPLYLGLSVLFAATGAGFVVCRFDPFVGIFRFGTHFGMLAFGVLLLAVGVFVCRPYCRYLCPYGVILGWCSLLSRRHMTITPDECIQCRLCEDACPFGAILAPSPDTYPEHREKGSRRLGWLLLLLPLLIVIGAGAGRLVGEPLSHAHATVRLGERLLAESATGDGRMTLESETFRSSGESVEALFTEGLKLRRRFTWGSTWLGAFMGLLIGGRLVHHARRHYREGYEPDRSTCFSCGRCFSSCPRERLRWGSGNGKKDATSGEVK